jgi:hypothetical protein
MGATARCARTNATAGTTDRLRGLEPQDVPSIARLHARTFRGPRPVAELEHYLADVFFGHPWRDERLTSLVFERSDGRIVGSVGVMPRPMWLGEEPILAAVCHNLMVDPEGERPLAAVRLLRAVLSGPQDLVLTDSNAATREFWERGGGQSLPPRHRRWMRVLRPAALAVQRAEHWGVSARLAAVARPLCRTPDWLARHLPGSPLRLRREIHASEPIEVDELLALAGRFAEGRALRPRYDRRSLTSLLDLLRRTRRPQSLRSRAIRGEGGRLDGWFVYFARPHGISRVLQMEAPPPLRHSLVESLLQDAWQVGSAAVSGVVLPGWEEILRKASCTIGESGHWVMLHSLRSEVVRAARSGDLYLSPLDGETWMRFV